MKLTKRFGSSLSRAIGRPLGTQEVLIVCHGNSLTQGSNETIPYPDMLEAMLGDNYRVINEGASGQTTQQLTTELADTAFTEYAEDNAAQRILIIFEARNDMVVNGITPTQAVDNLEAYCNAVPADFTKIYVCTTSADESGNANFTPTDWTEVNDLIRARWADFADALIDLAADARLQDGDDTTYFNADKIHFANGGNQVVADLFKEAIAPSSEATGVSFNAAEAGPSSMVLWAGDKAVTKPTATNWSTIRADEGKTTGKWYFELYCSYTDTSSNYMVGLATSAALLVGNYLGSSASGVGFQGGGTVFVNGFDKTDTTHAAFNYASGAGAPRRGMVVMIAVDFDAGKIWTGYNQLFNGDPVSGTGPAATFTPGYTLFPALTLQNPDNGAWVLQTTGGRLEYDPPPGFSAWGGGDVPVGSVEWNATEADNGGFILSSNNAQISKTGATWKTVRATLPRLTGKHVFELKCTVAGSVTFHVAGLCDYGFDSTLLGAAQMSLGATTGTKTGFTGTVANHSEVPSQGLTITFAVDMDSGKVWEARNGVWRNSGDPGAGTGNEWTFTPGTALFPAISLYQPESGTWKLLTAAEELTYPLPAGFSAWSD